MSQPYQTTPVRRAAAAAAAVLAAALLPAAATARPPVPRPKRPALLEAQLSPVVGPHAFGNEACDLDRRECVRTGRFFGAGASAELRLRIAGPLRLHARFHAAGNAVSSKPLYRSVLVPAVGLGAYGHRIFARFELQHVLAFGTETFDAPFADVPAGRARWGRTALSVAVGVRFPVAPRIRIEPWGGYVAGPVEERVYQAEAERRWLQTFVAGIGVAFALIDDPRPRLRARRRP